jgi:hypothetical protein
MSTAYAYARPQQSPLAQPVAQPRHIEIVTTRAQRRARPKSFYAVVAVTALVALFLGQLMMSIALSDGAYQISALQAEQKQLSRTSQALSEELSVLSSPQSLAQRAEGLGMVLNSSSPAFLRLADGAVVGTPTAATGSVGVLGASGGLVANALLDGRTAGAGSADSGAPSQNPAGASVASGTGGNSSPNPR